MAYVQEQFFLRVVCLLRTFVHFVLIPNLFAGSHMLDHSFVRIRSFAHTTEFMHSSLSVCTSFNYFTLQSWLPYNLLSFLYLSISLSLSLSLSSVHRHAFLTSISFENLPTKWWNILHVCINCSLNALNVFSQILDTRGFWISWNVIRCTCSQQKTDEFSPTERNIPQPPSILIIVSNSIFNNVR